jgi:hypothetical protein
MKFQMYLTLLFASSLVACGGASKTANNQTSSSAPTAVAPAPVLTKGMVTGFGSVIVNGVHYDVKSADIEIDGESQVESDLGVGQIVIISGDVDADGIHGKAKKLHAESQLIAPVDSIDTVTGVIIALGQTILINADTFYEDNLTAATLKVGDLIRISSYTNADGKLVATRIEIKKGATPENLQLTGKVADLNTTTMTFTLNGKTVDYSKATLADLPNKTLLNDMIVRVRGSVVNDVFVAIGNVHASSLDIKHNDDAKDNLRMEVGGLIKDLVSNTSFMLGDVKVMLSADTKFEGGAAADLANGILAKVKGKLNPDRSISASKVKLIFKVRVEDMGLVQSIDLTKNTVTVNGVTFEVTVDTSLNDRSKSKVRLFSLKDLVVGDLVNIRGYKVTGTSPAVDRIVATRIERSSFPEKGNPGLRAEVSGKIESVMGDMIKIAGHTVKVPPTLLVKGFADLQAFLSVAVGMNVEIKGVIENEIFIARKIELEDDEDEGSEHSEMAKSSKSMSEHSEMAKSSSSEMSTSEGQKSSKSDSIKSEESSSARSVK